MKSGKKGILHYSLFILHLKNLFQCEFLDETFCLAVFLNDGEDIADVNADATLKVRVELQVARHGFPVAIESKTDETTFLVIHA